MMLCWKCKGSKLDLLGNEIEGLRKSRVSRKQDEDEDVSNLDTVGGQGPEVFKLVSQRTVLSELDEVQGVINRQGG